MGRFSMVSSRFGARAVLAVDVSDAVEAAHSNAKPFPNVHVVQADIHRLPFRHGPRAQVDFAFSIGVLHHLDDPQAGFNALLRHLRHDGTIFAWVYGRENNGWLVNFVNPIRILLTSRLPRRVLYVLAWLVTVGVYPVLKLLYRPANTVEAMGWLRKALPYHDYLTWLGQFRFRYIHNVVFDHLVAPVAHYVQREEFADWFRQAGLSVIDMSWRNRNSWRGHGEFSTATVSGTPVCEQ
jgi:SAM-dependent methyltransferase